MLFPLATTIMFLLCPLFWGNADDSGFFYYRGDMRIPLTVSQGEVSVQFESGVTTETKASIFLVEPLLSTADWGHLSGSLHFFHLKQPAASATVSDITERLNRRPEVRFATPVLYGPEGGRRLLTDQIALKLPADVKMDQVRSVAHIRGAEVVWTSRPKSAGIPKWCLLRILNPKKTRPLDLLDVYRADSTVLRAVTDFISLDMWPCGSPPNDYYFSFDSNYPTRGYQWDLHNTGQDPNTGANTGTVGADINLLSAWDIQPGSPGAVIAILDSGADLDHPDLNIWTKSSDPSGAVVGPSDGRPGLAGVDDDGDGVIDEDPFGRVPGEERYGEYWDDNLSQWVSYHCENDDDENGYTDDFHGWDFAGLAYGPLAEDNVPEDEGQIVKGHGTTVASVAGAIGNNSIGVSGVCPGATIMPVRVLGGRMNDSRFLRAFMYAADEGAQVINCSWEDSDMALMHEGVQYARTYGRGGKGCVIVGAAGNRTQLRVSPPFLPPVWYPGACPEVVTVAITNNNDENFEWWDPNRWEQWADPPRQGTWVTSCRGHQVDLAAPYAGITASWNGSYWKEQGGTSRAAPHVAGLAALLILHDPNLTATEVQAIMQFSARDVNSASLPGRDTVLGWGRIDAQAALQLLDGSRMVIRNSSALHCASFDAKGNFIAENHLVQNVPTITPDSSDPLVIWGTSEEVLCRVSADGTVYIKGQLNTGQASLSPSANAPFVYRDATAAAVAYLDTSGNLELKGNIFEGANPDPE